MWKHEIIADASKYPYMEHQINTMRGAPCFYMGDFEAYGTCPEYDIESAPYDAFIVEFALRGDLKKGAVFVRKEEAQLKIISCVWSIRYNAWVPPPLVMIDMGVAFRKKVGKALYTAIHPGYWDDFLSAKKSLDLRYNLHAVRWLLAILSCKNITPQPVEPPEALNKKRLKRGKEPLYRYHVLTVDPNKGRSLAGKPSGKNLGTMPVHLCRGHFKEYTEERPLFGRITGRFWWQPFARGEAKNGVVAKDYKILEPDSQIRNLSAVG